MRISNVLPVSTAAETPALEMRMLLGSQILPHTRSMAELSRNAFAESPYFYSPTLEEETLWFEDYGKSPDAIACLLYDGNRLVGMVTGAPLKVMYEKFQKPFLDQKDWKDRLETMYFFDEEVILSEYKKGWGEKLYFVFEKAIPASFKTICFCKMEEPPPLNTVLKEHGFIEHKDLIVTGTWCNIGEKEKTVHKMIYWTKDLVSINCRRIERYF